MYVHSFFLRLFGPQLVGMKDFVERHEVQVLGKDQGFIGNPISEKGEFRSWKNSTFYILLLCLKSSKNQLENPNMFSALDLQKCELR